jgi:hypothetical protein
LNRGQAAEQLPLGSRLRGNDEKGWGNDGPQQPVALALGPENGAVSERLVAEAAREAYGKSYAHLYVIGFAIQPNARALVEQCEAVFGVKATYVQATPDLMMEDLLKTMRSSQIFSVCGMPDVRLRELPAAAAGEPARYQVELLGLDVFDPATMEPQHLKGDDVPAARHRLQRPGVSREPGVFSAHRRLGPFEEGAAGEP